MKNLFFLCCLVLHTNYAFGQSDYYYRICQGDSVTTDSTFYDHDLYQNFDTGICHILHYYHNRCSALSVLGVSPGTAVIADFFNDIVTYYHITVLALPCTLGTSEIENVSQIICYPNPASNTLNIRWDNHLIEKARLTLKDITGKTVRESMFDFGSASGNKQIDISTLNDGVYFLNINEGSDLYNDKVMVMH